MNKMQKILIIIPAYNEEENILKTYETIISHNKKYKTHYDVIVINDGSTDNTLEICKNNNIPIVPLVHNLGIGGAVQTGYKYALENDYDIAVQFDGDGQHDVSYIDNIISPIIEEKCDFVIGSRFVAKTENNFHSTLMRRVGIKLISYFIKIKTKKRIYDTTSGFRAASKKIIKIFADDYPLEYPEPITNTTVLKKGFRVLEVPVLMHERENGVSSIGSWKSVYYMINVIFNILMCE